MTLQEHVIHITEEANEHLLRATRAMPEDRLTWKPLDQGRTALDVVQECAQSALWFSVMLEKRTGAAFDLEEYPTMQAERRSWSLADCERLLAEHTVRLSAAIRAIPDEDLEQTLTMPWADDMVMSLADVMTMHYWNVTYHLGQVNYIQTLYGDKEMH